MTPLPKLPKDPIEAICDDCDYQIVEGETLLRVCELCGADEPPDDDWGGYCHHCDNHAWMVPKCPQCGAPSTFQYDQTPPATH